MFAVPVEIAVSKADGAPISEGLQQREALAERVGVPAEGTLVSIAVRWCQCLLLRTLFT